MVLPKRPSQFCECGKPAKVCQPCHDALQSQYQELLQAKNDVVRELHQRLSPQGLVERTKPLLQLAAVREVDRLHAWIHWLARQPLPPGLTVTLEHILDPSRRAPEASSSPTTDPTTPPDPTPASSGTG